MQPETAQRTRFQLRRPSEARSVTAANRSWAVSDEASCSDGGEAQQVARVRNGRRLRARARGRYRWPGAGEQRSGDLSRKQPSLADWAWNDFGRLADMARLGIAARFCHPSPIPTCGTSWWSRKRSVRQRRGGDGLARAARHQSHRPDSKPPREHRRRFRLRVRPRHQFTARQAQRSRWRPATLQVARY